MKMRMANILKEASAAKDLLAVQHGLKRRSGISQSLTCTFACILHDSPYISCSGATDWDLFGPRVPRHAAEGAAEVANADAWGCQPGQLPNLARFAVELDQRFLTELAHTTVLFNELFDQSGRKQLIKVSPPGGRCSYQGAAYHQCPALH